MRCPACSATAIRQNQILGLSGRSYRVSTCKNCDAIFSDSIYYGDFLDIIHMKFADPEPPPSQTRYFDFTTLGSKGIQRIHGWYDVNTRRVVQIG